MDDVEFIWPMLQQPTDVWGFVIYRCTYQDDSQWSRFMEILNERTRLALEQQHALDLFDRLDWSIRDDRDLFEHATKAHIRRHFNAWVTDTGHRFTPRYDLCVVVDQECVESALKAPQPPEHDIRREAFAILLDSQWKQEYASGSEEGESGEHAEGGDVEDSDGRDAGKEPLDEGYEPIDGCRMHDVGWMKIPLMSVAPRAFNVMRDDGWDALYRRPPAVARI